MRALSVVRCAVVMGVNPGRRGGGVGRAVLVVLVALGVAGGVGACRTPRAEAGYRAEVKAARTTIPAFEATRRYRWVERARLPDDRREACDLVSTPEGLVVAASKNALTEDGAAVFRLGADGKLERLLDWDGQGFVRVHRFGSRLVVPDADAPFHLLSFLFDWDVDGYVFVSDGDGRLDVDGRETLPASYHVFDAAVVQGRLIASTGAYPVEDVAYSSTRGPAAIFVDDGSEGPWRRVLEWPSHDAEGVFRFTWLETLAEGAVLAGVEASQYVPAAVRIAGLPEAPVIENVVGLQGLTLRWTQTREAVWHLGRAGPEMLVSRSKDGGRSFETVARGEVGGVVGTEGGLLAIVDGALAFSPDGTNPQAISEGLGALRAPVSSLLSVPLVVHEGHAWAASPLTGQVFEAIAE